MQSRINNRPARSWLKISIEAPTGLSEEVAGFLAALSGSGVEIIDAGDASERIVAYLAENEEIESRHGVLKTFVNDLQDRLPAGTKLVIKQERLLEEDWSRAWKSHFKAARLTPRLAIKPSWENYTPREQESVIELDPGMAFGTGLHASTRLALELIEECYPNGGQGPRQVLDVGTGTGILAMACALLGAERVMALDNDPEAVRIAEENILRNHLQDTITVSDIDLHEMKDCFELVLANIIHDTLIELSPALHRLLASNGRLILAGILKGEQEDSILAAYRSLGLVPLDIRHREEWAALLLTPGAGPVTG